jgi:ribosomal protein L15
VLVALACAAPFVIALACAPGNSVEPDDTSGNGTQSNGSGSGSTSGSGAGGVGGSTSTGFASGGGPGSGGFDECFGVSSTATAEKQPADIILAVDTSGSMSEESAEVQQNLNNFATIITSSGIDVHVVLIADASVCIPAPLGSGSCGGADEALPAYRHTVQTVNSNDALQVILATYPQWQPSLRPNATKTFVVVSDDNSDMSAADFTSQLLALDPPTFQGFLFHGIVANSDVFDCFGFSCPMNNPCCYAPGPIGCDSYGAAEGTVYKELAMQTMGISGDLCSQEFDPIFQDLAEGVIAASQLACEYAIPEPPMG